MEKRLKASPQLREALGRLFGDTSIGEGFLVVPSWNSGTNGAAAGGTLRANQLLATLERSVINMAAELDELGEEEGERLRAEARATLVAMREVATHFPELFYRDGELLQ